MYGTHGRLLRIDLDSLESATESIPDVVYERILGGIGLASYLLARWCPSGIDPLAPKNPLVFATSPFVGTGITTASKIAVATKSPQTGVIGDSLSSSYLAIALKRTGFDALLITGRAAASTILVIDDDRVSFRPAAHLLGLDPVATSDAVRAELGAGFRVAAIGVAGERGVRYAAISNDGRMAGRTGAGAVMGSKGLKAIAVRGSTLPKVAEPKGLAMAARRLAERSLGPGTAKYREIGTAANVAFFNRMGLLPNAQLSERAIRGSGSDQRRNTAAGAPHRPSGDAPPARSAASTTTAPATAVRETSARLEYETLFALGSLRHCRPEHGAARAAARRAGDGRDQHWGQPSPGRWNVVSRASTSATRSVSCLPGDGAALLRTIAAVGERRGIGELLADGVPPRCRSRRAGERGGAMHVKGLRCPVTTPASCKRWRSVWP